MNDFNNLKSQPQSNRHSKNGVQSRFKNASGNIKKEILRRSFWGRGNTYKKALHLTVLIVTFTFFFTGITGRLAEISATKVSFSDNYESIANVDTLQQGIGIQIIKETEPLNFQVSEYTVKNGDTVDSIAQAFNVSKETVKWANASKIDYYKENIEVNDIILIPEITGVLYEVQDGDSLDSVLKKTEGNRFEVIEINRLEGPDYKLAIGSKLLVPNGKLAPPPRQFIPQYIYPTNVGVNVAVNVNYDKLNNVSFVNPLSNPDCAGYVWNRGFSSSYYFLGHDGVDLGKAFGCPIRAAAAGTVSFAGWSNGGQGYNVRIDHGNGVSTLYYHGNGSFYQGIYPGATVSAGQEIMYMGQSGFSQGIHLHLSLQVDGIMIDPAPYIPY